MKVLFCNIALMKYYRGIIPNVDEPMLVGTKTKIVNGAQEQYNFLPCQIDDEDTCLGYFSVKAVGKHSVAQTYIETIDENLTEKDLYIDDVLVIWCAKKDGTDNRTVVVGWYKHARVYRYHQEAVFGEGEEEFHQLYNVVAKAKDCVLLPSGERCRYTKWNVPRMKKGANGAAFGFYGNSNIWYAKEEKAKEYVKNMVERIKSYNDENWIDKEIKEVCMS